MKLRITWLRSIRVRIYKTANGRFPIGVLPWWNEAMHVKLSSAWPAVSFLHLSSHLLSTQEICSASWLPWLFKAWLQIFTTKKEMTHPDVTKIWQGKNEVSYMTSIELLSWKLFQKAGLLYHHHRGYERTSFWVCNAPLAPARSPRFIKNCELCQFVWSFMR